ncbi:hypothetical protein Vadar_012263 [Vaccinium darrowii]|uniref:Uncharacterized protein n=1 Tax=Vaccinium darrowii TaxID=229202 RepID=A0ACB7YL98_9ERIC|nr:hypothetical protein Vadar_012263 [Vaccinium darrowii]
MGDKLRVAVGAMGNAASVLLYASPTLTFSRVTRKKSTEEFSCVPYVVALLNCFLYTWYGFPVVSYRWENLPLVTVNGVGILLEILFIVTYFWFSSATEKASHISVHFSKALASLFASIASHPYRMDHKFHLSIPNIYVNLYKEIHKDHFACLHKKVALMTVPVILVFFITATISAFGFHDHHHRKVFVGIAGFIASVAMYGSPLVVMSPNFVGTPLGILQLVLYFMYRKKGIMNEPHKPDIEKNGEKAEQQLQSMDNEDNNGKV